MTNFSCETCGNKYSKKESLAKHVKTHTGKRRKCPHCEKTYVRSHSLKIHIRTHTGEKPYSCPECDYKCTRSDYLDTHMSIHTGKKRHSCLFCDSTFNKRRDLLTHSALHTGQKPYGCSACGERFRRRPSVTKHINEQHPNTDTEVTTTQFTELLEDGRIAISTTHKFEATGISVSTVHCDNGTTTIFDQTGPWGESVAVSQTGQPPTTCHLSPLELLAEVALNRELFDDKPED
ncbi:C2H2-type zinc finger protein [Candidatus Sororendozoicomonas aggregata]|uniref:C2H2-type zinc finger protein n=1 Tax=Candidatus Sororendozoicomonas aggregata TaxID=3073239 RepID=UPI002ED2CA77